MKLKSEFSDISSCAVVELMSDQDWFFTSTVKLSFTNQFSGTFPRRVKGDPRRYMSEKLSRLTLLHSGVVK